MPAISAIVGRATGSGHIRFETTETGRWRRIASLESRLPYGTVSAVNVLALVAIFIVLAEVVLLVYVLDLLNSLIRSRLLRLVHAIVVVHAIWTHFDTSAHVPLIKNSRGRLENKRVGTIAAQSESTGNTDTNTDPHSHINLIIF